MTTPQIIQTTCEIIAAALLVTGFIYEDKLVIFEEKIANRWRARK